MASGPLTLFLTVLGSLIAFLAFSRREILAEESSVAVGKCPVGEYLIGLKQRHYAWKQGDSDPWRGSIGLGNISIFCSDKMGNNETSPDRLHSDWDWGYNGNVWRDYEYGTKLNRTWDQFCSRPVGVFTSVLFTKSTYGKPKEGKKNMTQHAILSCCYEEPLSRDDLRHWEYVDPDVRNCSGHKGLVGICGVELFYDDGWYKNKKGEKTWYPYSWGVRRIEPVCCQLGASHSL